MPLVVGLRLESGLGLDLVSGWLAVMHTYYFYNFPLSLSLSPNSGKKPECWRRLESAKICVDLSDWCNRLELCTHIVCESSVRRLRATRDMHRWCSFLMSGCWMLITLLWVHLETLLIILYAINCNAQFSGNTKDDECMQWRRLHGTGGRAPIFTNGWARGHRE